MAKLRILEARRAEDRERLREVDRLRDESEEWLKVKEKTKGALLLTYKFHCEADASVCPPLFAFAAKILELSGELKELKRQNKDLQADRDAFETKFEDLNDQVEVSLLDKEMAEERYEAAESALEVLKEKAAELEVELGVLREESGKLFDPTDPAASSGEGGAAGGLELIKLSKQNERLKDALVRMRDLTSESEGELKRRISEMEKELDLTGDVQAEFENNLVELERAEMQVEELKARLDDALGAEDMLEQLTERNLNLSEVRSSLTTFIKRY